MALYLLDYLQHNFVLLFVLAGIVMVTEIGQRVKDERVLEQRLLVLVIFLLSVTDCVDFDIQTYGGPVLLRISAAVLGYCLRPMIGILAVLMIDPGMHKKRWLWVPLILNALVYVNCFFNDWCISFRNNEFHRGPLYITVFLVSLFYGLVFLLRVAKRSSKTYVEEGIILGFCVVVIASSAIIDSLSNRNRLLFPVLAISTMFYYVYEQLQQRKIRTLQWEIQQQNQQNQLMISQIQPHFMYNTLATASYLCSVDPPLAERTINQFAEYLRQNMNVIGNTSPIPFMKELEHTRIYTEIEKLRFDNIEVIYNIEDDDFMIPALSVQPMVENAIRHGVRARAHGIVEVHTWRTEDSHMVEISDNGIGFNVNGPMDTSRPHIGLKNVKARLEGMVNGTMVVDSTLNVGTRILMSIPLGKEEN